MVLLFWFLFYFWDLQGFDIWSFFLVLKNQDKVFLFDNSLFTILIVECCECFNVCDTLTHFLAFFTLFYLTSKQQPIPPHRGGADNNSGALVPENALDALLDELQTFAKPEVITISLIDHSTTLTSFFYNRHVRTNLQHLMKALKHCKTLWQQNCRNLNFIPKPLHLQFMV